MILIGIDPAYNMGLCIINNGKIQGIELGNKNKEKCYNMRSYFVRAVSLRDQIRGIIDSNVKENEEVNFILETPVPRGFTAPILYMLDTLILDMIITYGDVYLATSKKIQSITSQKKVDGKFSIKSANDLMSANFEDFKGKVITSSHIGDASLLMMWLYHNKINKLNILNFNPEKWDHEFEDNGIYKNHHLLS
jgi:hypothetical protein